MGRAKCFFLFAFFIFQSAVYSQSIDEQSAGSWLEFSGTNKLSEHWSIPLSGILRHHDLFDSYDFSFIRTGASFHFNKTTTLTGGIAHVNTKTYMDTGETSHIYQYWIYEEFSLKQPLRRGVLSHRWRLENRWIRNNNETHFNNRARYRLLFHRPIRGNYYITTFNELFVNLSGAFFNQNRFYIGLGRALSPNLKVDIGYLKNHFPHSYLGAIRMGISFTLDVRSKTNSGKADVTTLLPPP
ncbi:DUF2490 domain-containing protein [Flagellimonas myxillae]|uniref:DUF2490 domain-containing protein n=1 Tax=Flagellimonas myxillae TaxID=2942214 RepID=UPI00201F4534|nr:DUF2490 domain-containing protein [Muricauda myxillae]MCL6267228.1 DUF2490 domain-containing protein [Muricauda myxillae]